MSLAVSELTLADYDEVVALWRATPGIGLGESDERDPIAIQLRRNPGMSFVAREGGRIVGAILCTHDGRRGTLHHLAVAESHRRRGIGRELAGRALARLREAGIAKCNIFLFADNEEGARFWRVIGFSPRADLRVLQRKP